MDTAFQNASARLDAARERFNALEEQIAELRLARERTLEEIARTEGFIRTWYDMAGIQPPEGVEPTENATDRAPIQKRPKNPSRDVVAANALDLIAQHGRPMTRKEIFDALVNRGLIISGKDPEMVLSTMLWREAAKVARLPGYGYWPATVEYRPAHYYPEIDNALGVADPNPEEGAEPDDD